jgi:hypothetical protein
MITRNDQSEASDSSRDTGIHAGTTNLWSPREAVQSFTPRQEFITRQVAITAAVFRLIDTIMGHAQRSE